RRRERRFAARPWTESGPPPRGPSDGMWLRPLHCAGLAVLPLAPWKHNDPETPSQNFARRRFPVSSLPKALSVRGCGATALPVNLVEWRMRRRAPCWFVPRCRQTAHAQKGMGPSVAHDKACTSPACIAFTALVGVFAVPAVSFAQSSSTTGFSGQAFVVRATVPPLAPITVADTGPLPPDGGAQQASILDVAPIS